MDEDQWCYEDEDHSSDGLPEAPAQPSQHDDSESPSEDPADDWPCDDDEQHGQSEEAPQQEVEEPEEEPEEEPGQEDPADARRRVEVFGTPTHGDAWTDADLTQHIGGMEQKYLKVAVERYRGRPTLSNNNLC